MPLILREQLKQTDLAPLRALVEATGFFTPSEVAVAVELMEDRISKGNASDYKFLLAEEGASLLGYACYGHIAVTRSAYDLYWVVVHPQAQSRGTGSQLLAAVESMIRKANGTRFFAETSSQPKYESTRKFYEKNGFAQESILRDFYAPGDHRLTYSKTL